MALDLGTDDKKKLYILGGLLAVFAIVGLVIFNPFGGKTSATTATTSANTTTGANPSTMMPSAPGSLTSGSTASPLAGGAAKTAGPTGTTGGSAAQYIAFRQARTDPFVPHYIPAIPLSRRPKPPPPPPPPRQPLLLPQPDDFSGGGFPSGDDGLTLPPARIAFGADNRNDVLTNLPQVSIPQYKPREAPRLTSSAPFETGGGSESTTARLSGVVIGDSVRALVEVTRPDGQTVSHVVQPGDEIEGIRILRLERVTEGGQSVTRMTVSQNGREEYFTLRPSSTPRNTGGLGAGGFPGGFSTPSVLIEPP